MTTPSLIGLILFGLLATPSLAEKHTIPVNNADFNVTYEVDYNDTAKPPIIWFDISVKTVGWVGIGFNDDNRTDMKGADLFIGGIDTNALYNREYSGDYYVPLNATDIKPVRDKWANYFMAANETVLEDGTFITSIRVNRFLDTLDAEEDVKIQKNKALNFIWAYNNQTDDPTTKHTHMGVVRDINFDPNSATLMNIECLLLLAAFAFNFLF